MFLRFMTSIPAMEGRVFRKIWRNPLLKSAAEMMVAIAAGLLASVIVLELPRAFLGLSIFDESTWADYAFGGVCGWMGWYFVNKRRKNST